jgi:hypothetical protein
MDWISEIRWRPQIGDPSFMGWLTVVCYALAALACAAAARRAGDQLPEGRVNPRTLWVLMTLLLGFLCVNKQLDLQSLLTDLGRVVARHGGWYQERRRFQKWFVLGVLVSSAVLALGLGWKFSHFLRSYPLLFCGLFFLLTFIVVRAISFHHVDAFLRTRVAGIRMNWLLELTGIFLVLLAAFRDIARHPAPAILQPTR